MVNAKKIKSLRESRGMTLRQAADKAGWGKYGWTRWHDIEAGRRTSLELKTLEKMAKSLGCSATDLFKA